HEEVVVDRRLLDDEAHVADRPEAIVVRHRAVVVNPDRTAVSPTLERGRLPSVGDDVDLVDEVDELDPLDDRVDDRPPADREQLLRPRVGERAQPRGIARGEDERLHAATGSPARDVVYGARCTPPSVTIAAIRSAGVTSKAGLRAANRSVTSAGSRSSIGIAAPSGVRRSTVELGATT